MKNALKAAAAVSLIAASIPAVAFADDSPAAVVQEYMEVVVNGREFDRISEFVDENIIQRNPNLPNGREPLREFWVGFLGEQPEAHFTIVRTISDGNLVVEHSLFRSSHNDRGAAVVDIYRVEDGLIVEHWDVVQPIPEAFASGNHPVLEN